MSEDLDTTVETLFEDLSAALEDHSSDTAERSDDLEAVAERAAELVAETEIADLLAAVGLDAADGRPESLLEAVGSGDPQHVVVLRSLLTASRLPRPTANHEHLVDELSSLVEPRADASLDGEATDESHSETKETESDSEETDSETEAADDDSEATADNEALTASLRDRFQSELEDTLDIFEQIPELGAITADDDSDAQADAEKTDTAQTADDDDSTEDTDDSSRSSDGTRWQPGGGSQRTTHSTIPTTGRRDIGRSGQFSSMRGSTVSRR